MTDAKPTAARERIDPVKAEIGANLKGARLLQISRAERQISFDL